MRTQGPSVAGTKATAASQKQALSRVDELAETELEHMSSVRKIAVDELSEAHAKLAEEVGQQRLRTCSATRLSQRVLTTSLSFPVVHGCRG